MSRKTLNLVPIPRPEFEFLLLATYFHECLRNIWLPPEQYVKELERAGYQKNMEPIT